MIKPKCFNYEKADDVDLRNAEDVKPYLNKMLWVLEESDIDKSGRGYIFPRIRKFVKKVGKELETDWGDYVLMRNIRKIQIILEKDK